MYISAKLFSPCIIYVTGCNPFSISRASICTWRARWLIQGIPRSSRNSLNWIFRHSKVKCTTVSQKRHAISSHPPEFMVINYHDRDKRTLRIADRCSSVWPISPECQQSMPIGISKKHSSARVASTTVVALSGLIAQPPSSLEWSRKLVRARLF